MSFQVGQFAGHRRLGPATTIDLAHLAFEANNERHPNP